MVAKDGPPPEGQRMEDRFARELDWARKHLPDEHPPFVAVTMEAIRCAGRRPTVGEVRERLKALGRDRKSIDERARRYRT